MTGDAPKQPAWGQAWELPADEPGRLEAALWAYRTILLREAESLEAARVLARNAGTAKQLRDAVVTSHEARAQRGFPVAYSLSGDEPPQPVQVRVTGEQREALFRRVQQVWHALGQTEPHWSVVTSDEFRAANIERNADSFYASGEANVATLGRMLARNGIDAGAIRSCIDFGCGVGRLSVALARRFAEVHAVDVSAAHLEIAREAFARRGIANATCHLLETIDGVARLPEADLVYSMIVLQHNPPPVMRALFAALLGRLRPGGAAVIQVPTYLPAGYRFQVDEYLASPAEGMEMHALPQSEAFAAAREAGADVLEVLEDNWTGFGIGSRSNTFVLRRPA